MPAALGPRHGGGGRGMRPLGARRQRDAARASPQGVACALLGACQGVSRARQGPSAHCHLPAGSCAQPCIARARRWPPCALKPAEGPPAHCCVAAKGAPCARRGPSAHCHEPAGDRHAHCHELAGCHIAPRRWRLGPTGAASYEAPGGPRAASLGLQAKLRAPTAP
jgi:hypothetical protein